MSLIDWIILTSTISFIVIYGVWKNERHKNLVSKARECLGQAFEACSKDYSPELIAVHLNDSSAALSEILGKSYGESLLDKIFLEFCIGK